MQGEVDVKELGPALAKFSKLVNKFSHSSSALLYESPVAES